MVPYHFPQGGKVDTLWLEMKQVWYFDNAATTKISDRALHAYIEASNEDWGNPSSRHKAGREARALLEGNRATLASLLGVSANQLFFTACSTESNAIVLQSLLWSPQPGHVIIPSIEHNAVKGYVHLLKEKGWNVSLVDAPEGFVDPDTIASLLTPQTRMVAIMLVNNVTGTIQPVKEIVQICKDYQATHGGRKIHVHTDATQALGKIPFRLTDLGVDSAAFSAHKLQGPKGVGLLYNTDPAVIGLSRGGEQEAALRPGTENTPGIAAMTVAVQDALSSLDAHYEQAVHLNHMIRIELDGVVQFLTPTKGSSPWILNITTDTYPSEVFTRMLYDADFCVSAGSACSNNAQGKQESVITAMRFSPAQARGSIRISLGYQTTEQEVMLLCQTIRHLLGRG